MRAFASARRTLRIDDERVAIAGRPFKARRLDAPWRDVQSIEVGERWAVVTTRTGQQRKLDLANLESEAAVRAALLHARDRLGALDASNTAE